MTDQTELGDFDTIEPRTDGGQADEHYNPEAETVSDAWVGVFVSCAWGYDQTQQNYAQIVDVSESGKTVLCQRVGAEVVDRPNKTTEHVLPTAERVGPEFRLHVREGCNDEPVFRGSYPYIWSELQDSGEPSTRMGTFLVCDDNARPDYQTAPNAGH
jgi:hypothetical protein